MNLVYTQSQKKFRAEIRSWLQQNKPEKPLKSFDTAEGFAEHRAWERVLYSGRWSMVTWPQVLGGQVTMLQRPEYSTRSQARCSAKPSAVSKLLSGFSGLFCCSQLRISARNFF